MSWVRLLVLAAGTVLLLSACDDINSTERPDDPIVLEGADLGSLLGADPSTIVAFAHGLANYEPVWRQIPVQIDERVVVDYGSAPASNAAAGSDGTVYGTAAIGVSDLQYADPGTFVGADSDPTFDADDELVFMAADGGGTPRAGDETEPAGVVPGSGVEVRYDEPLAEDLTGWVYLFVSDGSLDPAAGEDYVDYDFSLDSGAYKSTYKRADGPNPEASVTATDHYRIGFSDRWIEDDWRIGNGGAYSPDLLDGVKDRFALSTCARSNVTFSDAEGAFVANIDGPVRGIRSFVGANSGPLTQRTHVFYRSFEETRTDLRVHSIPSIMNYVDYRALTGSSGTYYSSTTPGGVPIDGTDDAVSAALPAWELVTSTDNGSIAHTFSFESSLGADPDPFADWYYEDDYGTSIEQCWGDTHLIGAHGLFINATIPNTDPRNTPYETLRGTRFTRFAGPEFDSAAAAGWAEDVAVPLDVTVAPYVLP